MTNITPIRADETDLGFGGVTGTQIPFVKPGVYDLSFRYYETVKLFGGTAEKLAIWFEVVSIGSANGLILPRYYNAKIKGKACNGGNYTVSRSSSFLREYVTCFGMPHRLDRIPMSNFKNVILLGEIKIVTKGYQQDVIPKPLQYSVIKKLTGIKKL